MLRWPPTPARSLGATKPGAEGLCSGGWVMVGYQALSPVCQAICPSLKGKCHQYLSDTDAASGPEPQAGILF